MFLSFASTLDLIFLPAKDIKAYYVQATDGIYGRLRDEVEDLSEDVSEGDLDKCKLGYIRKKLGESFAEEIKQARTKLMDDAYLAELAKKVKEAVDGKLDL